MKTKILDTLKMPFEEEVEFFESSCISFIQNYADDSLYKDLIFFLKNQIWALGFFAKSIEKGEGIRLEFGIVESNYTKIAKVTKYLDCSSKNQNKQFAMRFIKDEVINQLKFAQRLCYDNDYSMRRNHLQVVDKLIEGKDLITQTDTFIEAAIYLTDAMINLQYSYEKLPLYRITHLVLETIYTEILKSVGSTMTELSTGEYAMSFVQIIPLTTGPYPIAYKSPAISDTFFSSENFTDEFMKPYKELVANHIRYFVFCLEQTNELDEILSGAGIDEFLYEESKDCFYSDK